MRRLTVWALLALGSLLTIAPTSPLVATSEKDLGSEPLTLEVLQRHRDFEYKLRLSGSGEVAVSCDRFTWHKVVVAVESRSALGHYISCVRSRAEPRKLVIWVHGGPWAAAGTDLVLEQLAFLQSGHDLFVPLYPGSSDRPMFIDGERMVPDIVDAMEELATILKWGRERYGRVDVVGESFGGFLSASLAPALVNSGSLYLINPSFGGERHLIEHYLRTGDALVINGLSGDGVQAEAARLTAAYFNRLNGFDAMKVVKQSAGLEIKLIYGGADPRILPAEIAALRRLAVWSCGIDYRPDAGHEFGYTRAHYDGILKLIRCGRDPPCSKKEARPTGDQPISDPH